MENNKRPIEYAEMACEAIMHCYSPEKLPPEGSFFYHQGVFLSGMQRTYLLNGKRKFYDYIKAYIDNVIDENGVIKGFEQEDVMPDDSFVIKGALTMLDCKQPSVLLYNLYDETKDERYKKALDTVAESMHYWPSNQYGGYWHMMTQHNQMWLDGAYMAGPLSVMYDHCFGDEKLRERAVKQILIMNKFMRDEETGLYFHGCDFSEENKERWADPKTGLSGQIWGRAVGWYAVAILDIMEYLPKNHPQIPKLCEIEKDLLQSLLKFRDEKTGGWFEILDKPERDDNWFESSCTNLIIYSIAKALRMGIIDEKEFADALEKAYDGMIDSLYCDDEGYLVIDNICIGTCIEDGTYEFYINRPTTKNDLHGAGAFVLMCCEMENYRNYLKRRN